MPKEKKSGYLGINGVLVEKPVYFYNENMRAASISNLNAIVKINGLKQNNSSLVSPLFSPKGSEALQYSINSSIYQKRNEIKLGKKNVATRVGHRSIWGECPGLLSNNSTYNSFIEDTHNSRTRNKMKRIDREKSRLQQTINCMRDRNFPSFKHI